MAASASSAEAKPTPLLSLVWKLQQSADELLLGSAGVGLSHTRIMAVLDSSIPRSQRQVAVELRQTEANISRQIRVMADDGLVKIAPNKKDHRQRDVTLTSKGQRIYSQADKLLKDHSKSIYKNFSSNEKKDFESSVAKILRSL